MRMDPNLLNKPISGTCKANQITWNRWKNSKKKKKIDLKEEYCCDERNLRKNQQYKDSYDKKRNKKKVDRSGRVKPCWKKMRIHGRKERSDNTERSMTKQSKIKLCNDST